MYRGYERLKRIVFGMRSLIFDIVDGVLKIICACIAMKQLEVSFC